MTNSEIVQKLFCEQDLQYRNFHSALVPALAKKKIIGVRLPVLRKLAKTFSETDTEKFLGRLPHKYYEENQLHAILLSEMKDYEKCVQRVEKFLPYIDNWATCDCLRPKVFGKHHKELLPHINNWLGNDHSYTIRFAIEMLMVHFLEDDFKNSYLAKVSKINSDDYYVRMMQAWYFAEALVKQQNVTVAYLAKQTLLVWTHNKAIQKACESFRISKGMKIQLRKMRR